MPVDITSKTEETANIVANAASNVASPIPSIGAITGNMDTAQKKFAEIGMKKKVSSDEEFDPTDNDPHCLFDLAKCAIEHGAKVKDIDLNELAPRFEEDAKQKAKKYTAAKVASFFTGSGFMFIVYMFIEYLKTL